MTCDATTFEQIEGNAETAEGLALLAKNLSDGVRALVAGPVVIRYLAHTLRRLVDSLTTPAIEELNPEQFTELVDSLSRLHRLLVRCSKLMVSNNLINNFLIGSSCKGIIESTEDIGDILENMHFSRSARFANLVQDAVKEVNSGDPQAERTSASMSH